MEVVVYQVINAAVRLAMQGKTVKFLYVPVQVVQNLTVLQDVSMVELAYDLIHVLVLKALVDHHVQSTSVARHAAMEDVAMLTGSVTVDMVMKDRRVSVRIAQLDVLMEELALVLNFAHVHRTMLGFAVKYILVRNHIFQIVEVGFSD